MASENTGSEPRTWTIYVCPTCGVWGEIPESLDTSAPSHMNISCSYGNHENAVAVQVVEQRSGTEGELTADDCPAKSFCDATFAAAKRRLGTVNRLLDHIHGNEHAGPMQGCQKCLRLLRPDAPESPERQSDDATDMSPLEEEERIYWNRRWFQACQQLDEARRLGDGLTDALEEARRCEWSYPNDAERDAIIANAEERIEKAHALGWGAARSKQPGVRAERNSEKPAEAEWPVPLRVAWRRGLDLWHARENEAAYAFELSLVAPPERTVAVVVGLLRTLGTWGYPPLPNGVDFAARDAIADFIESHPRFKAARDETGGQGE